MSMKKQSFFRRALCIVLILAMLPLSGLAAETGGMNAFTLPDPLPEMPFTDVDSNQWYYESVQRVYALTLMEGTDSVTFTPNGTVPLSQGLAVAVRIYEKYYHIDDTSEGYGGQWYAYYVDRARTYGILPDALEGQTVTRPATRAELAEILSRALPESELRPLTDVETLPDYSQEDVYWNGVILLYRAGVIQGNDQGLFLPDSNIRRSELAAMLTRLVLPETRVGNTPSEDDPVEPSEPVEPPALAPEMSAFTLPDPLPEMPFADVLADRWYYDAVHQAYAMSLMNGVSMSLFSPDGTVLISQVTATAVRIYELYHGLPDESEGYGSTWYEYYMDRAKIYGILPQSLMEAAPTRAATRAEVAAILHHALPGKEFTGLNTVEELPDYGQGDTYWTEVCALYRAGVLSGNDNYGTFRPNSNIRRSELAAMLTRLVLPETRKTFTLTPFPKQVMETIVYGTSGAGRELKAYRYGDGENVMVVTFAIHGYEDNFAQDGQMLVDTAQQLMSALRADYDNLVRDGDWSVYVLPCLNPDGLYDGWTHNGPGRCTTYALDSSGNLIYGTGIDMNRCFPYSFSVSYSSRYYTGSQPLMAREAQALADFVSSVKGDGDNVLIDTHGWYSQIIVSGGTGGTIYQTFKDYFSRCSYASLYGGTGYFSSWAAYVEGYDACLFEFPNVTSASDFRNKGYAQDYVDAVCQLLRTY